MIPTNEFMKSQLGVKIIQSLSCVETKTVERTWKERLFSLPWHPRVKTKSITVPMKNAYFLKEQNVIVCHPSFADRL